MKINFISVQDFEDTRTIYSASRPVETFMGSDTENIIDTFFNTILKRIQEAVETLNERESGFAHLLKCWIIILSFSKNRY